jgi:Thrombospondin type 3 repeat
MRILSTVALALLAACFAPVVPEGNPCAPNNSCPEGLFCVSDVCVADPSGGPPPPPGSGSNSGSTDLDLDGVLNDKDNCPNAANVNQHDEDLDLVGDACDNCPQLSNRDQKNADADGLGDLCDPRPVTAGDKIDFFFGFDGPLPAAITTTGTWVPDVDSYRQTNTNAGGLFVEGTRDKVTVEIVGKVLSHQNNLWITVSLGEANNRHHTCGYFDDTQPNPDIFSSAYLEIFDGTGYLELDGFNSVGSRLQATNAIRINGRADSTTKSLSCATEDLRGTTTHSATAPMLTPGRVGMRSEGATYSLSSIMVISQP